MDLSPPVCRDPRPVARGPGNPCRLFRAHANEKLIPRVAKRGLDLLDLLWCIGGGPGGGQHQKRRASFFTAFDILQPPKQQVRRRQPETIRQPANQRAASQTDAEGGDPGIRGICGAANPPLTYHRFRRTNGRTTSRSSRFARFTTRCRPPVRIFQSN